MCSNDSGVQWSSLARSMAGRGTKLLQELQSQAQSILGTRSAIDCDNGSAERDEKQDHRHALAEILNDLGRNNNRMRYYKRLPEGAKARL